jgi:rhodanese-related sulfurtransferase
MKVQMVPAAEVFRQRQGDRPPPVIDVRTPSEFASVHAEGALPAPLDGLDPAALAQSCGRAANDAIYVICRSGARAARACAQFHAAGFPNVFCVEGGTDAWEKAGLPLVRGTSKVISLERQVRLAAGALVLAGVLLGLLVHPWLLGIAAFVGAGLFFSGLTDWCGMAMLLAKLPWNRTGATPSNNIGDTPVPGTRRAPSSSPSLRRAISSAR